MMGGPGIEVASGRSLVIEPGVVVRFESGMRFDVDGTLTAVGTPSAPILFTSAAAVPARGDWDKIAVWGTADLQHARMKYAGTGAAMYPGATLSVLDSEFYENSYAVRLNGDTWATLRRLTASGTGWNGILITDNLSGGGTWTAAGIPYILRSLSGTGIGVASPVFTIEPGTVVKFEYAEFLTVTGDLIAEGTPANPIVFTSLWDDSVGGDTNGDGSATAPVPGFWERIELNKIRAPHRLRHLDLRYANDGIWLETGWESFLHDSTFSDFAGRPVWLRERAHPSLSGLTATRCQAGNGVWLEPGWDWGFEDGSWTDPGIPYIIDGVLHFGFGSFNPTNLTVEPGTVVKLTTDSILQIHNGLVAEGTAEEKIVFTSINDDTVGGDTMEDGDATPPAAEDWDTLDLSWFERGGDRRLSHVEVRYATTALKTGGFDPATLTDILFADSSVGLDCQGPLPVTVDRAGFLRHTTAIHARGSCDAAFSNVWASHATTGLLCEAAVTVDGSDFHQTGTGMKAGDGCDAVVTGTDFVGNGTGVTILLSSAIVDLGDVSDLNFLNDGWNSFVCNTSDVWNNDVDTVPAENNWWGELPPVHSEIVGPVDIDPYDAGGSNAVIPDLTLSKASYGNDVSLEWRDRAVACGYRVVRSTMPNGGFTDISGWLPSASYDDVGAGSTPDSYFYYVVID
jgi:hypothetical protein